MPMVTNWQSSFQGLEGASGLHTLLIHIATQRSNQAWTMNEYPSFTKSINHRLWAEVWVLWVQRCSKHVYQIMVRNPPITQTGVFSKYKGYNTALDSRSHQSNILRKISKPYTIYAPNMRALGQNILAERRHKKTKEDHHIKLWYEYCISLKYTRKSLWASG